MKKLLLLIITPFLFVGCSSEDVRDLEVNSSNVIGSWKLTESYIDPGDGSGSFENVEDGYEFSLNEDGTFVSERFGDLCDTGNYRIEDGSKLIFQYDCVDFSDQYTDIIRFDGRKLVTSPLFPLTCIEECSYRFSRQ